MALFKDLFNQDLLLKKRSDKAVLTFKLFISGFKFGFLLM